MVKTCDEKPRKTFIKNQIKWQTSLVIQTMQSAEFELHVYFNETVFIRLFINSVILFINILVESSYRLELKISISPH